ncbi:MAG: SDR family oxidoreductase [candidate division NC10 bacterium]|nr:SDR family oxidoreductase [candidate division NC10 bacterium]MBI4391901.1 SDR family oxidoreductase [candidate division NC10 bacterium]
MGRDLRGKVAVITGASAGIGRATAEAFARAGVRLVLGARRPDRLEEVAQAIRTRGGEALAVVADVAEGSQVETLVGRAVAAYDRLNFMVANAGIGYFAPVEETPLDVAEDLWRVNVLGTLHAIRAALPVMRRQGAGHLIVVSSVAGKRGAPGSGVYAATKFAQVGLCEALRVELAGTGIAVSVICPVGTATEFFEAAASRGGLRVDPMGPVQTAERVAAAIVRCARRPRPEVLVYPPARLLVILNALAPRLVDRILFRFRRRLLGSRFPAAR